MVKFLLFDLYALALPEIVFTLADFQQMLYNSAMARKKPDKPGQKDKNRRIKLRKRQQMLKGLGKVLIDSGKLAIGGLVFGGIIRGEFETLALILGGLGIASVLIFVGLWLDADGEE